MEPGPGSKERRETGDATRDPANSHHVTSPSDFSASTVQPSVVHSQWFTVIHSTTNVTKYLHTHCRTSEYNSATATTATFVFGSDPQCKLVIGGGPLH